MANDPEGNGELTQPGTDLVLVAHGWFGHPWQFRGFLSHLQAAGFDARAVAYPSVIGSFENAVEVARRAAVCAAGRRIHLIGFSLGGLVMRGVAADALPGLVSLLLIGTPNAGSPLADLARRIMPTGTLRRLATDAPRLPAPPVGVTVGCIAGVTQNPIRMLMREANDGRVAVASALAVRHDAAIVLPYRHVVLPFRTATQAHVVTFLRSGHF